MPTVGVRRIIAAPQQEVWDALADIENAGRWNQAWQDIEFLSRQRQGVGTAFRAQTEGGQSAEFEVVAWEPPEYIAFAPRQTPEGEEPPAGYLITLEAQAFHLRPREEGRTEVSLLARADSHGLRGWLVGRLFWPGFQKQGMRKALAAVAALFEPEPEGSQAPRGD
jgi:uncharacterized protein YndB with AHSA1/START domain